MYCLRFADRIIRKKKSSNFVLNGRAKQAPDGAKVFLYPLLPNVKGFEIDTNCVQIKNEQFTFKGKLGSPVAFTLQYYDSSGSGGGSNLMILDSGYQSLEFSKDSFIAQTFPIIGSKLNAVLISKYLPMLKEYDSLSDRWYKQMVALYDKYSGADLEEKRDLLNQQSTDQIAPLKQQALYTFTKQQNEYELSLWLLLKEIKSNGYSKSYEETVALIPNKYLQTDIGVYISLTLAKLKTSAIGSIMPVLKLYTLDKKPTIFNNKYYRASSYTLVDFWFAHCGSCIRQFPALNTIAKSYPNSYFKILSVTIDETKSIAQAVEIMKHHNLDWKLLWDIGGKETMSIISSSFPSNILLDRNGIIIAKNIPPMRLKRFLQDGFE